MDFNHSDGIVSNVTVVTARDTTVTFQSTGAVIFPSGNTAQAPSPTVGGIRYNTDLNEIEFAESYPDGVEWGRHLQMDTVVDSGTFTGFFEVTSSSISFDNTSRTFTISPTATEFEVYHRGSRIVISSPLSIQIPDDEQVVYFYIDAAGALHYQLTQFAGVNVQVGWVYWCKSQQRAYPVVDQRLSMNMPFEAFKYAMLTTGPVIESGFELINYTTTGTGALDDDARISIKDGTLWLGGLYVPITNAAVPAAPFEQILNGPAEIPMNYLVGTSFPKDVATTFPLKQGTSRAQYNLYSGGTWSTVDAVEGYHVVTYLGAAAGLTEPIFGLLGDGQWATKEEAVIGSNWSDYVNRNNLQETFVYTRPLYALIFQTSSSYANTPKARLVKVLDLSLSNPAGKQTEHSQIKGLLGDDHLQYVHNNNPRTITAQHTFAPTTPTAPFALGTNALGQIVTGLNADLVDGHHSTDFQANNSSLTALTTTAISSTGLYTITGVGTSATREVWSPNGSIIVTNPGGIGGNIAISLATVATPQSNVFVKVSIDQFGSTIGTSPVTNADITTALGYTPVNKAGDTMLGDLSMGGQRITNLIMSNAAATTDAANKGYVDSKVSGLIWQEPVEILNLMGNLTVPPVSANIADAYIIDTGGNTGIWSGFVVGDLVQLQPTYGWRLITHVAIDQDYVVAGVRSGPPVGYFAPYQDYLLEITGGVPGAWTYTFYPPVNNYAVNIHNANAYLYGSSYTYSTDLVKWVAFSTSVTSTAGPGLYSTGPELAVGSADTSRIVINADTIDLATTAVTPGTYTKVTVDAYGRATLGANISSSDVTGALGFTPQTQDSDLTALANTTTAGIYIVTGSGTSATRSIVVPTGMTITNPAGIAGNITIALADDLAALEGLGTTGLAARTGTSTWATRSIVVPAGMTIANADGVSNNPTISLTDNLLSIQNLVTTGIVTSITASNYTTRSFSGATNQISVSNGDLVAGNGTISLASDPIIPGTASLTLPTGTFAQRPVSPTIGMIRYDSTYGKLEAYFGSWSNVVTESTALTSISVTGSDLTMSGTVGTAITNATLATVNSNLGQYAITTVNGKGLVTAATNLVMTGDASGTSSGANISATLATVNSNVGAFGSATQVPTFTVNGKGLITSAANITISAVSSVSVLTANGLAGTVANATTTPAITLSTTVTGMLKGNGTSISSATAGTDYVVPTVGAGVGLKQASLVVNPTSGTATKVDANTVPVITDGVQVWSGTATPQSVNSKVTIDGSFYIDHNTNNRRVVAAFWRTVGAVNTLVGVSSAFITASDNGGEIAISFYDAPATTSTITYSMRVWANGAGTWYVAQGSTPIFGGALAKQILRITETS